MWRRPTGGRCSSGCCATCWPSSCRGPGCSACRSSARSSPRRWRPWRSPSAPRASPPCSASCRSVMPAPERFGAPGTYPAKGEEGPRGAAHGLRAERARPRHQRRDDPAAHPARLRGRGRRARRPAAARSPTTWARRTMRSARARRSVDQWTEADVDAVVITASGCGTTIKDYGHMLRLDPAYAEKAKAISAKAKDVTEFLIGARSAGGQRRLAARLSLGLLHAARPEDQDGAAEAAAPGGLHRDGGAGGPPLLRLGRHLQHPAARDRRRSCATRKVANIESLAPQAIATGKSAASRRSAPAPESRSSTRWNCSTGPMAGRSRRSWWMRKVAIGEADRSLWPAADPAFAGGRCTRRPHPSATSARKAILLTMGARA